MVDVRDAREADAWTIADIYNQGILSRNATFETELRTPEERISWLDAHDDRHPVLVAETDGTVVGWASINPYSARNCYRGVGEISIYVDSRHQRQGIGRTLMEALITRARDLGYWKLMGRLFPTNVASRALCRLTGFREVGILERHAQLDGAWKDNVLVERLIMDGEDTAQ